MIVFYTQKNIVEINGMEFAAGELTTDLLNLSPDDYHPICEKLEQIKVMEEELEKNFHANVWKKINEELEGLSKDLRRYKVFQSILPEDDRLFAETKSLTEKYAPVLNSVEDDRNVEQEIIDSIAQLDRDIVNIDIELLPEILLVYPGGRSVKWKYYKAVIQRYEMYLHDVRAFSTTIHNFLDLYLRRLKHYSADDCAASLHDFYSDPRAAEKLIVNPIRFGGDCYTAIDSCMTRYVPRPTVGNLETFGIYEEHQTNSLQAFLKADFMCSMMAGYVIRRCLICKKYFLLKKAYHTLYCDRESPMFQGYTCHQVGSLEGQRELAKNTPKIQSKLRAFDRIKDDRKRKIITEEEEQILKEGVRDMLYEALRSTEIDNDAFEKSLQIPVLYPRFGIERRVRPRGRPRKEKAGENQ